MSLNVILPGGFHPFHAGHRALYEAAKKAFPGANIYVAATNDTTERPFPFALKEKLARLSGVKPGEFIQVKNPFQPREITTKLNPNSDAVLFVRSEKDKNEHPIAGGTKKDGTPSYFQPWNPKNVQPFGKHAHLAYLPTVEFGPGITSATEIRDAWPTLNDKRKLAMIMSLYPAVQKNTALAKNVVGMFDQVLGGQTPQDVAESSEQKFKVTYDVYHHNKEKPLYTDTKIVRANSEEEAIAILRKLVGGTNYRIEKDMAEGKKDKDELFIQADPESDQLLRYAQQHYPTAGSKQQAFIKFVQRALKHSEEEDKMQDQEIAQLEKDVTRIKDVVNKIQVSESADYLEEK